MLGQSPCLDQKGCIMCVKPAAGLEENDLQLQLTECNIYSILVGFLHYLNVDILGEKSSVQSGSPHEF